MLERCGNMLPKNLGEVRVWKHESKTLGEMRVWMSRWGEGMKTRVKNSRWGEGMMGLGGGQLGIGIFQESEYVFVKCFAVGFEY